MAIRVDQLAPLDALPSGGLDEKDLSAAADANRRRIDLLEVRMQQVEQEMVKAQKEQHLLESLLALRRGEAVDPALGSGVSHTGATYAPEASTHSSSVSDAAVAVLHETQRPMHIGELMAALQKSGVRIPGAGAQANLIAYLRRDDRIARPSRGMYGLKELGVEDYEPKRRNSRRKGSSRKRSPKGASRK